MGANELIVSPGLPMMKFRDVPSTRMSEEKFLAEAPLDRQKFFRQFGPTAENFRIANDLALDLSRVRSTTTKRSLRKGPISL